MFFKNKMKLLNWRTVKELFFSSGWRVSNWEEMFYSTVLWSIFIVVTLLLLFTENKLVWWIFEINIYSSTQFEVNILLLKLINYLVRPWIIVLYIIMNIFLDIKRCHDRWRKGSRLWCLLIPIFNIWAWIEMMFLPWQEWKNKYWKKVNDVTTLVKVIAIILMVIAIWYFIISGVLAILSKF